MDLKKLSIRDLAKLVRQKKLHTKEILAFHLTQIKKYNAKINALRAVNALRAEKALSAIQKRANREIIPGRLPGVIFSAKDSISVEGLPRSDGTLLNASKSEKHSSACIEWVHQEGATCIGKANMAEYGKSYFTDNVPFGRTRNPYKAAHSAGGSGGGDAAAVATHMVSFGVGADAGGSIRVPANFCGVFGLSTTRGLVSTYGLAHPAQSTAQLLRSLGPLARNLDDLEIAFSILSRFDPRDPYALPFPVGSPQKQVKRIGYFSKMNGVSCSSEISRELTRCAKLLSKAGYELEEITPTVFAATLEPFIIIAGQATLELEDITAAQSGNPRDFSKESLALQHLRKKIKTRLPPLTSATVMQCWNAIDALRHNVGNLFAKYDLLLAPVAACSAPTHDTTSYQIDDQTLESHEVFQFSSSVNALGLPALAFPTGWSRKGLPLGLQLIGPRFSEWDMFATLKSAGLDKGL